MCWFGHVSICVMPLEGKEKLLLVLIDVSIFKILVVSHHCCFSVFVLHWHANLLALQKFLNGIRDALVFYLSIVILLYLKANFGYIHYKANFGFYPKLQLLLFLHFISVLRIKMTCEYTFVYVVLCHTY